MARRILPESKGGSVQLTASGESLMRVANGHARGYRQAIGEVLNLDPIRPFSLEDGWGKGDDE